MGKQERERERRREESRRQGEAQVAERRTRVVRLVGSIVFAALLVVAILIVASQSGSDDEGGGDVEGAAAVRSLLRGIPQNGTVLGDPGAAEKIVEFGDLQCPVCRDYSTGVIEDLIRGAVSDGAARLEFRNWAIIGPESRTAAKAALAAGLQGRYWQFVELFYRNQGTENSGYVTDEFLRSIAEGAGVSDLDRWEQDRRLARWNRTLVQTDNQALDAGFTGTPSILISGPGGEAALGTPGTAEEIENALTEAGNG